MSRRLQVHVHLVEQISHTILHLVHILVCATLRSDGRLCDHSSRKAFMLRSNKVWHPRTTAHEHQAMKVTSPQQQGQKAGEAQSLGSTVATLP